MNEPPEERPNEYRKTTRRVVREGHWTIWKILPIVLVLVVILGALGFLMKGAGLLGSTFIERKVFENSYQRTQSIRAQIATDEATLAEIRIKLKNPNLDPNIRNGLEAQAAAARSRIAAARSKQ